jgi:uncharacterized cupin superfamily protein
VAGPYRTSLDAVDGWEPFELADGSTVGEVHLLRGDETDGGAYYTGLWRVTAAEPPPPFPYEMAQNETIYVIEGELTIEVEGGPALDLGPGDVASFTPGTKTTWRLRRVPFREVFVLS